MRTFYIPENAILTHGEENALAVYQYGDNCAVAFRPKAQKPDFRYRFPNAEKRDEYVAKWLKLQQEHADRVQKRRDERKSFQHTLKVGDILYSSWGYDQTNIDFYQVTAVKGKHVEVTPISGNAVESGWSYGRTTPIKDSFKGEPSRYLVGKGNCIKVRSFAWAYPVSLNEDGSYKSYHYSSDR